VNLTGTVALITGAASGIGQNISYRLAADGATVVCTDIVDPSPTVATIRDKGGIATGAVLDVRSAAMWKTTVDEAVGTHGGLHVLVNVAGFWLAGSGRADTIEDIDEEGWDRIIGTNLKGTWLGIREAVPHMRAAGGGRIVNISSLAGLRGVPGFAAYSSSKGGIQALTRAAAVEFAKDGILVNAVAPGAILTPAMEALADDSMREALMAPHLIRRMGKPDDVSAMVAYLVGEGGFTTGATLPVDGGWTTRGTFSPA
jgi:NAD(P)-dependent dehydrogenase (short-subunit alcohol dehydrogenase family)